MNVTPRETLISVLLKPDRKIYSEKSAPNQGTSKPPLFAGMSFWVKKKSRQGMNNLWSVSRKCESAFRAITWVKEAREGN